MRSSSLPTCTYPPPRALRGLPPQRKSPGLFRSLFNRPSGGTANPAPRLRVRKQWLGDFRPGRCTGRLSGREARAAAFSSEAPCSVCGAAQETESGALTSQRGELGLQASTSRGSSRTRDLLASLVPVPELTGPLPQLCPLPSLSYSVGPQHPQSL